MKSGTILGDRTKVKINRKGLYVSDRDATKAALASGYFKDYGKRAGNRLARRTGDPARVCRDSKHLPW